MKKFLVVLLLSMSTSHAFILFEPLLGYTLQGESGAPQAKVDSTGTYLGGRLGVNLTQGMWVAGEYQSGSVTREAGPDVDYDTTEMNMLIGFNIGYAFRLWFGFGLDGDYIDSSGAGYEEGGGSKFGFGFRLSPHISLNLEWKQLDYSKTTGGVASNFEKEELLASVSFPFTI